MTFSRLERIDVRHLTTNQPFCGGVIPFHRGRLVVTLHSNNLPSTRSLAGLYRVGDGLYRQEQGETLWACALRSVRTTLSSPVQLETSATTYFHNIDNGEAYQVVCTDTIAPFLLERQSNLYPYTPSRAGLPKGSYTYYGFFLAQVLHEQVQPGMGVVGLLLLPPELLPTLSTRPVLASLVQQGAELVERETISHSHQLWLHPDESFGLMVSLLQQHPELLRF